MRLIDADEMVQRLEERLKELDKKDVHIAEDSNGFFDILIDHLMLGSEIRTLREWINKQPTIEAEPVRHGRWEDCSSGWMCSRCSFTQIKDSNYCPNCGAKMDGGNDEADRR